MQLPLMGKKKKPHTIHHSEVQRKESVYEKTMTRLGEGLAKLGSGELEAAKSHFFDTVRTFFADFLTIHYQFTYEELKTEVERKRLASPLKAKIMAFVDEVTQSAYHPEGMSGERLERHLLHFGEIAELLKKDLIEAPAAKTAHHAGFFERFGLAGHPAPPVPVRNEPLEHACEATASAVDRKDLMAARSGYEQVSQIFEGLPDPAKANYYDQIIALYHKVLELH